MERNFLILLFVVWSLQSFSHEAVEEYNFFKSGQYEEVIKRLEALGPKHKEDTKHIVLLAKSYFKLESYRKALKVYNLIIDQKATKTIPPETFYEYAQINYALDNLKTAKKFFEKSHRLGFKKFLSLYYIGVIHHSEGQTKMAHQYYDQIITNASDSSEDKEIKQAAYAQKAELRLSFYQTKLGGQDFRVELNNDGEILNFYVIEKTKKKIKDRVVALLQEGIDINPEGNIVPNMKNRILQITKKYELDTTRMINGRFARKTDLVTRLNAVFSHDSNVVNVSDENPDQPTEKKSFTGDLKAFLRKKYTYKGRYFINPELNATYKYHFDRDVGQIFTNDNAVVTPAVRISREHTIKGKPASTLFDLEYSYTYRDYNSREKLQFYSQAYTVSVGERARVFDIGESSFRLKYKDLTSFSDIYDSTTVTAQYSQFFNFKSGNRFIFVSNLNITDSETDSLDTDSLSLIGNYVFFPTKKSEFVTFFTFGMNLTAVEYKDPTTSDARGTEVLYNPSISATKIINSNCMLTAKYAYSYNDSKDEDTYTYDKHLFSVDYAYTF